MVYVTIGHAVNDERGKSSGGKAGDQTEKEVRLQEWYQRTKGWSAVFRAKDKKKRELIARAMEQACANDCIGYDQSQRTTLYDAAKLYDFDMSKITKDVETDCSALVSVCCNAAGIVVSKDMYTGNEKKALEATGEFTVYTETDYLTAAGKLIRGDILLGEGHTAIVTRKQYVITKEWEYKKPNLKGKEIKYIQKALNKHAKSGLDVDGVFGQKTGAAVVRFQKSVGLSPDGIVGKQTVNALGLYWKK